MSKLETKKTKQGGFTLIEVVLVLAIGGLIFLLAFLAFQQASVNRRDTQRRSDAARIVAEIANYQSDTGSLPSSTVPNDGCGVTTTTFSKFVSRYLCKDGAFEGPQGAYTFVDGTDPDLNEVVYTRGANCDGGSTGVKVEIGLEKGIVCKDDQ